ncbi:ankyrin repeat domain containing protein [Grosmannia clavigera kw1407]|uniref:Ankyrin repeat domain containing protein n=1 Tax=Grosmannia clavigera (strain kw1407 / UAMH 11150) TaxID=655863 RepID=F0XKY4_GROCL|nr:ankyrin repeat domain containing protein [Grosmannia clavigera kw1407]EFX01797.1 ankyrin repeat domain containing protein [Grosmannia clavigera kw1407]
MQYVQNLSLFTSDQDVLDKNQALFVKAIRGGNLFFLQRRLITSDDPASKLPPDSVAMAVLHGHADVVGYLLDIGMSVEKEGPFGPPLRTASLTNQLAIAELLVNRGASVNAGGRLGDALYVAAMKGHTSIARLLLDHGASARQEGAFYGNALQAAAYFGHKQIVELLLASEVISHSRNLVQGAFYVAAEGGHENSGRNDSDKSWPEHEVDFATIFAAASTTRLTKLLEADTAAATPWYMDRRRVSSPLIAGARAGHTAVVQFYLMQKKVFNYDFFQAANITARNNHLNVVRVLLKHAVAKRLIKDIFEIVFEVAETTGITKTTDFALYIMRTIRRILASKHAMQLDRGTLSRGLQLAATHDALTIKHAQLDSRSIAAKRSTSDNDFVSTAATGHVQNLKRLVENQPEICTNPAIAAEVLLF